jgi:hypothetical protein
MPADESTAIRYSPGVQRGGPMEFRQHGRREFIALVSGMVAASPLAAYGQQPGRTYRIGGLAPH